MRYVRSYGVDVRRWFPELFGATSRQTLGFDEPPDDLLTSEALLDEAIEQLYAGRRLVFRPQSRPRAQCPGRSSRPDGLRDQPDKTRPTGAFTTHFGAAGAAIQRLAYAAKASLAWLGIPNPCRSISHRSV